MQDMHASPRLLPPDKEVFAEQRMPGVKHLADIVFVGSVLGGCTIGSGHIKV
ncbi:unnamed protein product [marine sediment metagenome]|uniref:Uncharacterized protein n=1 Tax=marine sediment metagenome TaxID=412755 RepID=X1H8P5_9ZZZZ